MPENFTKRIGLVRRREDLSHEQFIKHWLGTHATLCSKLPRMRRYSVNLVDKQRFPKFGFDGFSELWFDSEEDLVASLKSPEGVTLLADLPNFTASIEPVISVETQVLWP